jgi:hypothetical protein
MTTSRQPRAPPYGPLLEHQKRRGGLHADIDRDAARLSAESFDISEGGRATVLPNA